MISRSNIGSQLFAKVAVGNANEIPIGERKVVDTSAGAVVVANVNGAFYAVNAKCPHLGDLNIYPFSKHCHYLVYLVRFTYEERGH
jgi:nitrite reductase/ring-hydroxylating ferredoxin subunit